MKAVTVGAARRVEFIDVSGSSAPDFLAIASYGEAGTGKTTFGLTFPGPIGVIALDRKTRPRLLKANQTAKKKLLFPKRDFIRHTDPLTVSLMKPEDAIAHYTEHVQHIQDAIFTLAERRDVRSVIIDSATQLWEDILMKHFGRTYRIMPRDRGPANADMRDIFNSLQEKHLLVTHQAQEIWRNDKPTGKFEWAGWGKLDYYVNIILEHTLTNGTFSTTMRHCQDAPELLGDVVMTDDGIDFDNLAEMVYPGGEW